MPAKKTPSDNGEPSFEEAMTRLEAIVGQMESNELPLEDLLVRYEEGIKLVQLCSARLDSAEKRIEIITRNAQGQPALEEFEPEKTKPAAMDEPGEKSGVSLF